jgi:prepilin-type N-terminal cleavage/methylation domain-containing protein
MEIAPTLLVGTTNNVSDQPSAISRQLSQGLGTKAEGCRLKAVSSKRGVTLIELLIVVALIGIIAGISFPAVASGLDSLRLRSASDAIVTFLNTALDRAERRQQAVEVWISPQDNAITAVSADAVFEKRLDVPDPIHITAVEPALPSQASNAQRRFLLYPGGAAPRIGIEITNAQGRRRLVSIDPVTGFPRAEALP